MEWTTTRPKAAGVFAVRGWHLGEEADYAVVVVEKAIGGFLCNIHAETSEMDRERWTYVEDCAERFEWMRIGDLPPPPNDGAGEG